MSEVSVPPLATGSGTGNLVDYLLGWAHREPSRVLASTRDGDTWNDVTAVELQRRVDRLAKGFLAAGIRPGDRVALMSRTRLEWTVTDLALWSAGAVPVPVYETSSAEQVRWICQDSGAVAIIVEDAAMRAVVTRCRDDLPDLRDVWQIGSGSLEELAAAGLEVADAELESRRSGVGRDDLATVIYTSGTTGTPRGCELTHGNFMALADNACERLGVVVEAPGAANLLFLPLAHVFARFIQVVCLRAGVRLGHSPDARTLLDDLAGFGPTFVLAVPRVFEKIYAAAEQRAQASGRGAVFRWAARVAEAHSRAVDTGSVGPGLTLQHAVADRLVLRRLRASLGGRVRYAISGGAALGARLGHFFRGAGIVVLEGYGLTETTAPATVNTPDQLRIGTVGRPLPGVAVRVDDQGEILVRGVGVFRGYRHDPAGTEAVLRDGWLRTGDLGELDADGFLRITGRSKEVIVTAGGKNVVPGPLEDRLRRHPLVSHGMVVGEARPFVAALVTLDADVLPDWLERRGLGGLPPEEVVVHPLLRQEIQAVVDEANATVSRAESIRAFTVLAEDFTVEAGTLTPSLKLRRHVVAASHAEQIEAIYRSR